MNKLLFTILTILHMACFSNLYAQNTISFSHDANGNRTAINIIHNKTAEDMFVNDSINNNSDSINNNSDCFTIQGVNMSIFPNPTSDFIVLSTDVYDGNAPIRISLLSSNGRVIDEKTATSHITEIHLSECKTGVYYLLINYKDEKQIWKIIKN